jgi:hypothetical protein
MVGHGTRMVRPCFATVFIDLVLSDLMNMRPLYQPQVVQTEAVA